ncbi:alpha/beta hydrolase family protein [Phreatobacter oligotrophus]|uniref:alpha/beta hydrolase family protein n=1 Tax=Phreatobacter oligotrophus TaxID=1122261 RepID=UPI0023571AA9|nr:dienelactone hydrolase [Phreatobacter oligotrophus]MBX9990949.1 dienelactone hydrolase [Phreatobacter oligotrophus]
MFAVGFQTGLLHDAERTAWSGDGPRPLAWSAWYPAAEGAEAMPFGVPPAAPLFVMGAVAADAPLSEARGAWPVVLLSHGTGGTAASLGWLACRLAAAGHVVIGVDHHGNTAAEPYRPEAFLAWWDRPRDLTVLLDRLAAEGPFAGRLDLADVTAAGFSIGGYTVLALAGAVTEMALFRDWAAEQPFVKGPREFPDIGTQIEPLLATSAPFRAAWERQSADLRDHRVRAVAALAPAPPVRGFREASLAAMGDVAVTIVSGEADDEAPWEACALWLSRLIPDCRLHSLGEAVAHYPFLCEGTKLGRRMLPELFVDPPGIDRRAVHDAVAALTLEAFRRA